MIRPDRFITIRGARVHNLKGIDLDLPKGKVVVICGPSGSGKTSLAFDTLFVEGQRRYIDSFSTRIRQRLGDITPPDVDHITGLSPTVAIMGRPTSRLHKATVATLTGIHHHLRLVFTHLGKVFCYRCGRRVHIWNPLSIEEFAVHRWRRPLRMMIAFPLGTTDRSAEDQSVESTLHSLRADGWGRVIIGNHIVNLTSADLPLGTIQQGTQAADEHSSETQPVTKSSEDLSSILVVADRLTIHEEFPRRFRETLDRLSAEGRTSCTIFIAGREEPLDGEIPGVVFAPMEIDGEAWTRYDFPLTLRCLACQIDYQLPYPDLLNFNTAAGACPRCEGLGTVESLDAAQIFPDRKLSLSEGAVGPFRSASFSRFHQRLLEFAKRIRIPVDRPVSELSDGQLRWLLYGSPEDRSSCLDQIFRELERYRYKPQIRVFLSRWRTKQPCPACRGVQLRPEALAIKLVPDMAEKETAVMANSQPSLSTRRGEGLNIAEFCNQTVSQAKTFLEHIDVSEEVNPGAKLAITQVRQRLRLLESLGLDYLTLNRPADTLSQGEFRRTLLSAAFGSSLVNVIYILDEPSLGLHPSDVGRLREACLSLRDRGNTVIMVEHEEALMRCADWIIELGPGAGERGGQVVFQGTLSDLQRSTTLTAEYLSGKRRLVHDKTRRTPAGWIKLVGATGHNLKHVTAEFPLNVLCVVTGVSGAGKSSLIEETLYPALCQRLFEKSLPSLPFEDLMGERQISDVLLVDQSPISKTTRSNPATLLKVFDDIRAVFAQTSDAKTRGFTAGHFSFNSGNGRCGQCQGEGFLEVDMEFLPNMEVTCPDCHGRRYRPEVLSVLYRGKSIADVLDMTVREAYFFFRGHAGIQAKLRRLMDVGLEYLRLGQATRTLSGGESQRLKLASYFTRSRKKATLFILNEPTSGLHPHDIVQLLHCFESLLAYGHSLIVIEHNVHVMAAADYIIDLGPGPAERGGTIVAQGSPEDVARVPESITGRHLRGILTGTN